MTSDPDEKPEPVEVRVQRGEERLLLVEDPGTNRLVMKDSGIGMSIFSWLEQGWTIVPMRAYGLSQEAREFVAMGQKITAIKQVRADTGMGLKEAKEAVDKYCSELPSPNDHPSW